VSQQQGTRRARRRYTAKQREAALESVEALGLTGAAREHGIPVKTVWNWARRKKPAGDGAAASGSGASAASNGGDVVVPTSKAARGVDDGARPRATPRKRTAQRRYTPSEKAEILEYAAVHGPAAASREFGCTRYSVYAWRRHHMVPPGARRRA